MLSRNFRLQKVGDFRWLKENYDFSQVSYHIDELVVLDATRGKKSIENFCSNLKLLTEGSFVPIAAGGGIHSVESANLLLRSGADKVVINSELYLNNGLLSAMVEIISPSVENRLSQSLQWYLIARESRVAVGAWAAWLDATGSRDGKTVCIDIQRGATSEQRHI